MSPNDQTERDNASHPDGSSGSEDIYTSEEAGKQYRSAVYRDIDRDSLDTAPETTEYPESDSGRFKIAEMPEVPKMSHLVGPSAIMLGVALGSGETMFWPTLIAQNGWGLYWAFWVGVLTQFFINTEIQRWAIATGESIFQGYKRVHHIWPWFFLVAGFIQSVWPGWAAGAAQVFAAGVGLGQSNWVIPGIIFMVLIWVFYQAGPIMYNIVEDIEIGMMILAVAFAIILAFLAGTLDQFANVPAGAVNFGSLPQDMEIAVFLGGLAYAGAGGYANLSQGVWAREKGYGMGTYQGRVKNPLRGDDTDSEQVYETGFTFRPTDINLQRWKAWWNVTQKEHFLTFVVGLFIVGTVMMSISAEYAAGTNQGAIEMWLNVIIPKVGPLQSFLLYATIFLALFSTQYAVFESFTRNSVDILYESYGRQAGWDLNRIFWGFLTLFTLWGIIIIGLRVQEPWILLVLGAAIAGVMMWPYNALTIILNTTRLPEHTQPGWGRIGAMWWATGFFGYFSILLIGNLLVSRFGLDTFATTVGIMGSGIGGYVLWLCALIVQVYTMYRSAQAKLNADETVDNADQASGLLP
jgi:hypothetical protein